MAEKALTAVIQRHISPGDINPLGRRSGQVHRHERRLQTQVSRLCEEIDERITAFLDRPIEGDWSYLWIDATHLKGRQNGRLVSVATIIAVGVNNDGRREILGPDISPSEAQTLWTEFLRKLRDAGYAASSWWSRMPRRH
jgi:putative transposase